MTALDEVLEAYRDMFGVKSDRANETHRLACIEVSELRSRPTKRAADGLSVITRRAFDSYQRFLKSFSGVHPRR